jgi:hypothetical protein
VGKQHRKARRGPVQRLDLGLVHAQHQCLVRRIQVEADDISDLLDELRISAQLLGLH